MSRGQCLHPMQPQINKTCEYSCLSLLLPRLPEFRNASCWSDARQLYSQGTVIADRLVENRVYQSTSCVI